MAAKKTASRKSESTSEETAPEKTETLRPTPKVQLPPALVEAIREEQQRIIARALANPEAKELPATMHADVRALKEAALAAVTKALNDGYTALHEVLAQRYLARWIAGETEFCLASGRQKFVLPKVAKGDVKELERLAKATTFHSFVSHWTHLEGEKSKWGTTCSLSIGTWKGTCVWDYSEFSFGGESQMSYTISDYQDGLEGMEAFAKKRLKTKLPAPIVGGFVYLIGFDLLDQHRTPFSRPMEEQIRDGMRWDGWDT